MLARRESAGRHQLRVCAATREAWRGRGHLFYTVSQKTSYVQHTITFT